MPAAGFPTATCWARGEGWAKSILFNARARDEFAAFFARDDTFALGVCNGCQMMSNLHELIPGTAHWPHFVRNRSEQFEARFVLLEVQRSPSLFFRGMEGSRIPVATAHGEGYAEFRDAAQLAAAQPLVALRFVDHAGRPTEAYPANVNGSPQGITGLTTRDGRYTILMPHPERGFRTVQMSWHPDELGRGFPVDADVPQRTGLAGVNVDHTPRVIDHGWSLGSATDELAAGLRPLGVVGLIVVSLPWPARSRRMRRTRRPRPPCPRCPNR